MPPVAESTALELKYCEGCGALCLRPSGADAAFCPACCRRFAILTPPPAPRTQTGGSQ